MIELSQPLRFEGHKGLLRAISQDFYTGKYVPRFCRSTEHIQPKSLGGRNSLTNYAMTDEYINNLRGNKPLPAWLKEHPDYLQNMKNYIKKYWNTRINGLMHGQQVAKALKKQGIDLNG